MFLTEGRPDTPMSTASTTSSQTFDLDMSEHSVSQGQSPRAAYTKDAVGSPARMLTQSHNTECWGCIPRSFCPYLNMFEYAVPLAHKILLHKSFLSAR